VHIHNATKTDCEQRNGDTLRNSLKTFTMITAKQEAFCQALIAGRNQSDAYRDAYNTKPSSTAGAIAVSASKLMTDPKITLRIAELRKADAEAACWSRRQSIEALKSIALSETLKPTERIAAIRVLNTMFDFNAPSEVPTTSPTILGTISDEDWL
jgi:phosphoenolpyruvate-protein kinase (PTS system EI component)